MCFWRHKWSKWSDPCVTDPDAKGVKYLVQSRQCVTCGQWERKVCRDKL